MCAVRLTVRASVCAAAAEGEGASDVKLQGLNR